MTKDPLTIDRNGEPANIEGLWSPYPAFLVCSGQSLDSFPLERLKERGVVSMGVNNAGARAHVKAWVFSDPQSKFHHALYLDPGVMTFCPRPKMKRQFKMKLEDGFHSTGVRVRNCPNTYAFDRSTQFVPDDFFSTTYCHWGNGKHQPSDVESAGCLATLFIGVRLLYHLGVRTIYLLGVDHQGGRRRWGKEDKAFERLRPVFKKHKLTIFNCNPNTKSMSFAFRSFDYAIADCKGSVPSEPLDVDGWYQKNDVRKQCEESEVVRPIHFEDKRKRR